MSAGNEPTGTARRGFSVEVVGEIILLAIVGSFFVYMFVESFGWPEGSALMPRIAIALGTPFWVARLITLVRSTRETSSEMIMDLGFRTGEDPRGERMRFVRICLFIVGLYAAIWLVGFHIALPLGDLPLHADLQPRRMALVRRPGPPVPGADRGRLRQLPERHLARPAASQAFLGIDARTQNGHPPR